jgi:hypothetical protein
VTPKLATAPAKASQEKPTATDRPVEPVAAAAAIPDAAPTPSRAPTLGERAPVAAPHRPELASGIGDINLDLKPAKVTRPSLQSADEATIPLPIEAPKEVATAGQIIVDPAQELQEYYAGDPEGLTMAYCEQCGGPCIPIETPEGWRSKCCNSNMSGPDGGAFRAATIRNARERLLSTKDVSVQENHKSDYRGLWFNPVTKKWRAIIFIQDLTIYLGEYASEIIAAKVYDNACFYLHREFFSSPRALNFDSHYSGKVIPPIFRSTERAASRLRQRQLQPPVAGSHDFDMGKLRRELKGTKEEAKT